MFKPLLLSLMHLMLIDISFPRQFILDCIFPSQAQTTNAPQTINELK